MLPSLFTTGNLFLGFWAIILTLHHQFAEAAPLIVWAIVLDLLDGRIARLTGTTSDFGAELDSLADAVSFGIAPAVLVYAWGLEPLGRAGWLAAFLFAVCGVLRLARFNVQRKVVDSRYFVGLPIPAGAAQLATLVAFHPEPPSGRVWTILAAALVVVVAFLMVSTFRYRSFKGIDLRTRRSYINVLGIALLFLLVASHPKSVLLAMAVLYWVSGPLTFVGALAFRRRPAPPVAPVAGKV